MGISAEKALSHDNMGLGSQEIKKIISSFDVSKQTPYSEQKTITDIRKKLRDQKLILLEADKGGSFAVFPQSEYVNKIQIFTDENTTKLPHDPTDALQRKLRQAMKDNNLVIPTRHQHLLEMNPSAPKLRGAVKLHKPGFPIRPIVNNVNSPCYKVSKFLNNILQDQPALHSSHSIKNTSHLISCLENLEITQDLHLVSFDIKNMFTSIPVEECLDILEFRLASSGLDKAYVSQLLCLIKLVVSNNYYVFLDSFYSQPVGLAMGSPISPILADMFIDSFEKDHVMNNTNVFLPNIILWKRYVDDIVCIWRGDKSSLHPFLVHLNSWNSNIVFTMEYGNNSSLNFLDLNITFQHHQLSYGIFRKDMYSASAIHNLSEHHTSQKMSGFFSMLHRMNKSHLSPINYEIEFETILSIAKKNGFVEKDIMKLNNKVKEKIFLEEASTLESIKEKKTWRSIPFFGRISHRVSSTLKKLKISTAFKSNGNLLQILNPKNNLSFKEKLQKSGIYRLTCQDCLSTYIGQTGRKFVTRFKEHIFDAKKTEPCLRSNFSKHLHTQGHVFSISEDSVEILKYCHKGFEMTLWEKFYILKEFKENQDKCLNDKISSVSPIISSILHLQQ